MESIKSAVNSNLQKERDSENGILYSTVKRISKEERGALISVIPNDGVHT